MPDYGSPQMVFIISAVVQLIVFGLVVWLVIYLASSRRRNRRQQLTAGAQDGLPRPNIAAITDAQQARFVVSPATLDWSPEHVLRGIAAEQATARYLAELDDNWYVLHSRIIPGTNADLDHLVIGPNMVTIVDSKDWGGAIAIDVDTAVMNGQPGLLESHLQSSAYEARQVAERMNLRSVDVIVTFSDRMRFTGKPWGSVEVGGEDGSECTVWVTSQQYVTRLIQSLQEASRPWVFAPAQELVAARQAGVPELVAHGRAQVEFAAGLARQAAVTFPDAAVVPFA